MSAELIAISVAITLTMVPLFAVGLYIFQRTKEKFGKHFLGVAFLVLYVLIFLPTYAFMLWVLCINILEGVSSGMVILDILCRSKNCSLYTFSCSDMSACVVPETCTETERQRRAGSICAGFPYITSTEVEKQETVRSYSCLDTYEATYCSAYTSIRRIASEPIEQCWCLNHGSLYCKSWACIKALSVDQQSLERTQSLEVLSLEGDHEYGSCYCQTEDPTQAPTTRYPTKYPTVSPTLSIPCMDFSYACENYVDCCTVVPNEETRLQHVCNQVKHAAKEFIFSQKPCPRFPTSIPTTVWHNPTSNPTTEMPTPLTSSPSLSNDTCCTSWVCKRTIILEQKSVAKPEKTFEKNSSFSCTLLNDAASSCLEWSGVAESGHSFGFTSCVCIKEEKNICMRWECLEEDTRYVYPNLIIGFGYPVCFIMPVLILALCQASFAGKRLSSTKIVANEAEADSKPSNSNPTNEAPAPPVASAITEPQEQRDSNRPPTVVGLISRQITTVASEVNNEISNPPQEHPFTPKITLRQIVLILLLSSHGIFLTILNVYIWFASGAIGFLFSFLLSVLTIICVQLGKGVFLHSHPKK